jgi:hypothetical protein
MKSPFPGMDPYLERHWEDVHTALIGYVRDALQPQLGEDLIARMEEKVYVEEEDGETRVRRPDVRVVETPTPWQPAAGAPATAVLDEPMLLEPLGDPIPERSVLIYDSAGHRIVTAIEILSPWNKKPGKDLERYMEKRAKYIKSDMNLVEIDLVRTGDWTRMIGPYLIPDRGRTTYRVTVMQSDLARPLHYPISIRRRLPTIKIPLRPQDPPAKLDLQELIEKAYAMGRYDRIDYDRPCSPPFIGPEEEWAEQILAGWRSTRDRRDRTELR